VTTYKYGRRPPTNAPALMLGPLLTGVVPAHPVMADNLTPLLEWQMLGNDTYGDCVAVTWANVRRLMTAHAGAERYPTLGEVIAFYKTQNPGFPSDDNGMVIQTALEYLVAKGGPDGVKAVCFAKVDHTKPDEVKAAIAIFGYVWTGIDVLEANMAEFNAGQPWDDVVGSRVDGGHSVITGGYGNAGSSGGALGGDEKFITWAQETSFTDAFWEHDVEEAWVVVWPEHLTSPAFIDGVDLAKLASDYQALTGRRFPVEPTPPVPVPTPVPAPPVGDLAVALADWWAAVKHWAVDERHVGDNRHAALAAQALAHAAGLV
jgi:hypothetical protein